jgi:hypothetical protein
MYLMTFNFPELLFPAGIRNFAQDRAARNGLRARAGRGFLLDDGQT